MLFTTVSQTMEIPKPLEIAYAIRRNFGGLQGLSPVQEFAECMPELQNYQVYMHAASCPQQVASLTFIFLSFLIVCIYIQ